MAAAQGLTGALIGTVKDAQGGVISGARGSNHFAGPDWWSSNHHDRQWRAALSCAAARTRTRSTSSSWGSSPTARAGSALARVPPSSDRSNFSLAGVENSVVVDGSGSRLDARNPGFGTRFGAEDLDAIPMRRFSSYDLGQDGARDLADFPGRQQRPRVGPRFGRGSEPVPHRRHERHRDRQRRRASRSRHRLHSGTADPVGGRVGRVRQRPGRRRERHHQVRR